MSRITKQILEFKCERIRRETGLNIDIHYFNDTQRVVLRGVLKKGYSGCKDLSWCGSKKELGNVLDTLYNFILISKYSDNYQYEIEDRD